MVSQVELFSFIFCENWRHQKDISKLGGIQQLRGQNFAIFWPPPLRGQFLYPERGQKQTFFDPLLPSSCPRSYWMPPMVNALLLTQQEETLPSAKILRRDMGPP